MALQVNITNIAQVTYPVDVYVCRDCPDTDCTLVDTINSVPATITIPGPYSGYSSFGVKIIDAKDCEYCQIFPTGTTTTSSTSTTTTLNPLCVSCDIGFDYYDTNPISQISVGLVTASCDPSVTDYVIDWYGPGVGSTTVAFTSGYGTDYSGDYLYSHPLTGSSAVPVIAGTYTPVLQKIKINGVEYTDLNCFNSTTVDVDALTCINGSGSTSPYYSHGISFTATTSITPQPVTTTFILDPLKPYFAYRFGPEQIFDTLKITFYGSSYLDPIVIEYISVGNNLTGTNFNVNVTPKTLKSGAPADYYMSKVLTMTAFTINNGDYLEIEVTPNPTNNNTNWKFYCECLESFNCDLCYDNNNNPPFKIIQSTITQSTPTVCNLIDISFSVSACSDSDIYRYMSTNGIWIGTGYQDAFYNGIYNIPFVNMSSSATTSCINGGITYTTQCEPPKNSTITYNKTVPGPQGQIVMTFTDITDLQAYYNGWMNLYSNYSGNTTDCTDINYYRFFYLKIPLATGNNNCGDVGGYQIYTIHPSSIVTTGGTGPWNMTIVMNTINDCINFSNCDIYCNTEIANYVSSVNTSSTGITNNISITNNTGSRLTDPWFAFNELQLQTYTFSATTATSLIKIPKYINETIPYSGSPLTIIPNLSGKTCEFNNWTYVVNNIITNSGYYIYYGYYYNIRRPNPLDVSDFEIWTTNFTNGTYAGYPSLATSLFKIYEYIGGVPNVIDPSYFI